MWVNLVGSVMSALRPLGVEKWPFQITWRYRLFGSKRHSRIGPTTKRPAAVCSRLDLDISATEGRDINLAFGWGH